jgi:hypothetical protein
MFGRQLLQAMTQVPMTKSPTSITLARRTWSFRVVTGLLLMCGITVAVACESITPDFPLAASVIGDTRPTIRWRPVANVTLYRVQIQSRTPEGRVLHTFDQMTDDNSFRPPVRLAETRASVKLLLTAGCEAVDQQALMETAAYFHVDAAMKCPSPGGLALRRDAAGDVLEWEGTATAVRYRVRRIDVSGARRPDETETSHTFLALPAATADELLLIRPVCDSGMGDWSTLPRTKYR